MSEFREYDSVHRYNKEECEGLLNGKCYITEKVDGANASIYFDEENGLTICSHYRILYSDKKGLVDGFRGLIDYVKSNESIRAMITNNPNQIFYGEWVVKHTVQYPIELLKTIIFFDVYDKTNNDYMSFEYLLSLTTEYSIKVVPLLAVLDYPTIEQCKEYLNINTLKGNPQQEGIVIRNYDFINKYGRRIYAKIVNDQFKELNKKIFSKHSKCCNYSVEEFKETVEGHNEMVNYTCQKCKQSCEIFIKELDEKKELETKIALKYCTQARVEKIINKIITMQSYQNNNDSCGHDDCEECNTTDCIIPYKISEKDIPRLLGMVYNDIVTEEIWDIIKSFKNPTVNFKTLQSEIYKLTKKYFFEYLKKETK